jgi:hypothetical protein
MDHGGLIAGMAVVSAATIPAGLAPMTITSGRLLRALPIGDVTVWIR